MFNMLIELEDCFEFKTENCSFFIDKDNEEELDKYSETEPPIEDDPLS